MKYCAGSVKTVCTDDIKFRQYRLFFLKKYTGLIFYVLQITLKTRPFTFFFTVHKAKCYDASIKET